MRAQVVVFGPIERELHVRLSEDLLPEGTKQAEELRFRTGGCGVDVAERLSRLGLSTAILTSIGSGGEDKELLSSLRKRGVQTRGIHSGSHATLVSVTLRTPRHVVRMRPPRPAWAPSKEMLSRALRGSRHLHVCGSALVGRRNLESAKSGLRLARASGVSTSLDVTGETPSQDWRPLLRTVDVLLSESDTLRALAEAQRLGAAAMAAMRLGVGSIAVQLGAGGCRVYAPNDVTRVPSLGPQLPEATAAFASGVVLGRLHGASAAVCGLLGNAASLQGRGRRPPTRRELSARIARIRSDPRFRKFVPAMREAQRFLDRARR